jgi:hypothetical protein
VGCGLSCGYLRDHNGRLLAAIGRGVRDEDNSDRDDRGCRAGESRCRTPGPIPGPNPIVSCPDAAVGEPLQMLLRGPVDQEIVLKIRPPGCDVGSLARGGRRGGYWWPDLPGVVIAGRRPPVPGVGLAVLAGKGLPHTGSGTIFGSGVGGGVVVDQRAGPIVAGARPWLLGVTVAVGRRGRRCDRAGGIPLVAVAHAAGAGMSVRI